MEKAEKMLTEIRFVVGSELLVVRNLNRKKSPLGCFGVFLCLYASIGPCLQCRANL